MYTSSGLSSQRFLVLAPQTRRASIEMAPPVEERPASANDNNTICCPHCKNHFAPENEAADNIVGSLPSGSKGRTDSFSSTEDGPVSYIKPFTNGFLRLSPH